MSSIVVFRLLNDDLLVGQLVRSGIQSFVVSKPILLTPSSTGLVIEKYITLSPSDRMVINKSSIIHLSRAMKELCDLYHGFINKISSDPKRVLH